MHHSILSRTGSGQSMPRGAGKRQCQVSSVSSQLVVYLFHSHDRLSFTAMFWDVIIAFFFSYLLWRPTPEPSIMMGQEIIDTLELSCCWGGGRNQPCSDKFLIFLRTEISLILFTIYINSSFATQYLPSRQVPNTHADITPIYGELYLLPTALI